MRGNYNKWLNGEIVCFSCLKVGHISRNDKTRTPTLAPRNGSDKPERKNTWIEIVRAGSSGVDEIVITQFHGSSDHVF